MHLPLLPLPVIYRTFKSTIPIESYQSIDQMATVDKAKPGASNINAKLI